MHTLAGTYYNDDLRWLYIKYKYEYETLVELYKIRFMCRNSYLMVLHVFSYFGCSFTITQRTYKQPKIEFKRK